MEQRKEVGCGDVTVLGVLPAGYALLMLALGRWVAHLLGVSLLVVALPLAVAPILIAFGKSWKNSWIFVAPVAAAVVLAQPRAAVGNWREAAGVAFSAAFLWLFAFFLVGAVLRWRRAEG